MCEGPFAPGATDWILRCRRCGFLCSTLENRAGEGPRADAIDETARAHALDAVRHESFARILDVMDGLAPGRGRLLDVGCAHGWFLAAARERGWEVHGIEPDRAVAQRTDARLRERVVEGWFPRDLPSGERWEAISFHDVFEHLDDLDAAVAAVERALAPGGLVVVNLPWAGGVLHRIALALARAGRPAALDRLWQRGFPSPHLSYFTPETLAALWRRHGFEELHREALRTVRLRGLWARLRLDRTRGRAAAAVSYAGVAALLPWLGLLPADLGFQIFRRRTAGSA